MEMDNKVMMSEIGGAFVVSWLVLGSIGSNGLMAGLVLAAAMTAMAGAHILPMFTWMTIMTGDLADQDNWMNNGMRLVAQIVGALLAILMLTELGDIETGYAAGDMVSPDAWVMIPMVAAGAVVGAVHSRCDAWMTALVVVMAAGSLGMGVGGAHDMASCLLGDAGNIANAASTWIVDGALIGVGAMLGTKIDEAME
ncbi:MAG: hypothetical protein NLN66_03140 [Candidatus Thalassarchaeaceae archaeon]|nr:hypothetical protein [Candidatus Thalassarchaeaceae archaeon]